MLLSTQTCGLERNFGIKKAIDIIADAGFDAMDFSIFTDEHCTDVHDIDYYRELRKYAEDKGLVFNQSHAPYPSSAISEEETEERFRKIVTAMRNSSCLGVKNIIVHPMQHLTYAEGDNAERLFEMNMEFYKRLIPYCEEYGIHVALENVWQYQKDGWSKIFFSTCAESDEFVRYLDTLDNEWLVACLDIGHAVLVCEDVSKFIHKLGKKYLKALHVHDVDGMYDSHTLPYFGVTDWDKVTKALADINYEGDFTFEADRFFMNKPFELYPEYIKCMVSTGRLLVNKVLEYSK